MPMQSDGPTIWIERDNGAAALRLTGADDLDGQARFANPAQAEHIALALVALHGWPLAEVGTA